MEAKKFKENDVKIFAGSSAKKLAQKIADYVGLPLSKNKIQKFSDGEIFTKSLESVRGSKVFVVQSTAGKVNENLMELLIFIDVLKRASAKEIIAIIPYFGYARQDRTINPHDPITAKLISNLLVAAGATRIVTMELHTRQVQGFFDIPVDHMEPLPILAKYFEKKGFSQSEDVVVVAPDIGSLKRARGFAKWLEVPLAIVEKRKNGDGEKVILIDDMINTGKTVCNAADALIKNGATEVYCCATHAVFSDYAVKRLKESVIKEVVVTDTIELRGDEYFEKLTVLSTAKIFGEAVKRIVIYKEMSNLFVK